MQLVPVLAMFQKQISALKTELKTLENNSKGQLNIPAVMGIIFLVIIVGFGQFIVQNILTGMGIFTGLWTTTTTLWPIVAIFFLLAAAYAATTIFNR